MDMPKFTIRQRERLKNLGEIVSMCLWAVIVWALIVAVSLLMVIIFTPIGDGPLIHWVKKYRFMKKLRESRLESAPDLRTASDLPEA